MQHRHHPAKQGIEIEQSRLQYLLATVGEQLPGDTRGPIGRLADLGDVGHPRIADGGRLLEETAEPGDHRHHVVHFVGHAARDLGDGLHPLGLHQQLVGPSSLGDVDGDDPT